MKDEPLPNKPLSQLLKDWYEDTAAENAPLHLHAEMNHWFNNLMKIAAEQEERLAELEQQARLGAAVEAIRDKHPESEKIRCSIGIMNLLYPPSRTK